MRGAEAIQDESKAWAASRSAGDVAALDAAAGREDAKAQLAMMLSCGNGNVEMTLKWVVSYLLKTMSILVS